MKGCYSLHRVSSSDNGDVKPCVLTVTLYVSMASTRFGLLLFLHIAGLSCTEMFHGNQFSRHSSKLGMPKSL